MNEEDEDSPCIDGFGRWSVLDCTKTLMQKLWLNLEGNLIAAPDGESHEEWANQHGHELESLLAKGWVRIQNVPPPYLLIDSWLPLKATQAMTVRGLFENRYDKIVVEFGGVGREFKDGEEAMAWLLRKVATE